MVGEVLKSHGLKITKQRLKVLSESNDGFYITEKD